MKDNTVEFEAVATHKSKRLAKSMDVVEEVTLEGKGIYALELGNYNVAFTHVEPEPELNPCPRCGGEMYMLHGVNTWTAQCRQCGGTGPVLPAKIDAINAHNERESPEFDPCPHCPDCRTEMTKTVAYYKGDGYPVWECECSLDGLHDLISEELA